MDEITKDKKGVSLVGGSIDGLSLTWDNIAVVRQRMRDGYNLLIHFDPRLKQVSNHAVERSIRDVKVNSETLKPVCALVRIHHRLPGVDQLQYQVKLLYSMNNRPISLDLAHSQAWAIRHLLGVLKSAVRHNKKTGEKKFPKDQPLVSIS